MRVLIFGGTGMMGHMACRVLSERHQIFATCRASLRENPQWGLVFARTRCYEHVDCCEHEQLEWVLAECEPDVVLNCVGIVKQLEEAKNPLIAIRINALLPHELAQICGLHHARLIHLGTDCVFSGNRGNYDETATPDPVELYDRSKLLGEVDYGEHLTIRSSIIGRQLRGTTGLLEWFLSQKGKAVKGYTNAIYSGLTTGAMCRVISTIIEDHKDLKGLYHVASKPISKFDLLCRINKRLDLRIDITPYGGVMCDRSLNGSCFVQETSITIPSWDGMIDELAEDVANYDLWRR
jgi:dTDP-4-dehydrorhamnose reductase